MRTLDLITSKVAEAGDGETVVFDVPSHATHATFYFTVAAESGSSTADLDLYRAAPLITDPVVVATTAPGDGQNEIQRIDLGDFSTGDTTEFTFDAVETTGTLAFNTLDAGGSAVARAAIVEGILDEVITDGSFTVTEVTENLVYDVEFVATLAKTDVGAITITSESGFTPTGVTETQKGFADNTDEVQTLTLTGGPTHGTFTITWTGVSADISVTTDPISATASAAQVQAAVNDALFASDGSFKLSTAYDGRDIVVTRTGAGTSGDPYVFTLTFSGSTVADTGVDAVTVDGTKLYTYTTDTTLGIGNAWDGITQIVDTTAAVVCIEVGPDLIETPDDTTPVYRIQSVLPSRMAVAIALTGDGTTYSFYAEYVG